MNHYSMVKDAVLPSGWVFLPNGAQIQSQKLLKEALALKESLWILSCEFLHILHNWEAHVFLFLTINQCQPSPMIIINWNFNTIMRLHMRHQPKNISFIWNSQLRKQPNHDHAGTYMRQRFKIGTPRLSKHLPNLNNTLMLLLHYRIRLVIAETPNSFDKT